MGSKWVNELGFLVMMIIPVYGVSGFVDIVVLNTIEFWTGTNPMSANDESRTIALPLGSLVFNGSDKSCTFKQIIDSKEMVVQVIIRDGATTALDETGTVLARAIRVDGGVTGSDGNGNVVSTLTRSQVESMVAAN